MEGRQEAGGLLEQAGGREEVSGQEEEAAPRLTTHPSHLPVRTMVWQREPVLEQSSCATWGYQGMSAVQPCPIMMTRTVGAGT